MRDLELIFKALADETRLKILGLLVQRGELCVCDFVEVLHISQSKASRHLRYLLNAGLLQDRREAVWVHYRIAKLLSSERQAVVKLIKGLSKGPRLSELEKRLDKWQLEKTRSSSKIPRSSLCPASKTHHVRTNT